MQNQKLYYVWDYNDVDRAFWQEHLEDFLPDNIVDAHTHVWYPELLLKPITESKRQQYWVNELTEPITPTQAKDCYNTVFSGKNVQCVAFGYVSLEWDIEETEKRLAAEIPALGWSRLAVVRPNVSADELEKILNVEGTIGVKVYYDLIGYDPNTRDKYIESSIFDFLPHHQLEILNRRKAWVTLHVPKAGRLGHPDNIREVNQIREKYPAINLVIAHLGRCYTSTCAARSFSIW